MDYKQAAAGDREENNQKPLSSYVSNLMQRHEKAQSVSLEYAEEALDSLLSYTHGSLATAEERTLWITRLATYSKEKLLMLSDYSGGLNGQVWKFLDSLRSEPQHYEQPKALPEPRQPTMAKECRDYALAINADGLTAAERDQMEVDFVTAMRQKYPSLSWHCGRKANIGG